MSFQAVAPTGTPSSAWSDDPSPLRHQSITELLHDPRVDVAVVDIQPILHQSSNRLRVPVSAASTFIRPRDLSSINDFADYLRSIDRSYKRYVASSEALGLDAEVSNCGDSETRTKKRCNGKDSDEHSDGEGIPAVYFADSFSVASCPEFLALQDQCGPGFSTRPEVSALRDNICEYHAAAKARLRSEMSLRRCHISDAARRVGEMRTSLRAVVCAALAASSNATGVLNVATDGAKGLLALGERKENAIKIKLAVNAVARVLRSAEDAHALIDAANYSAAMDVVDGARAALMEDQIVNIQALAPARACLARAVERIDGAVKEDLRPLFGAEVVDSESMRNAVLLLARLGRSQSAQRAFIDETRRGLAKQLQSVDSVDAALTLTREALKRASLIHAAFVSLLRSKQSNSSIDVPITLHSFSRPSSLPNEQDDTMVKHTPQNISGEVIDDVTDSTEYDSCSATKQSTHSEMALPRETSFSTSHSNSYVKAADNSTTGKVVMEDLYRDILDMLCAVVDRIYGAFNVTGGHIDVLNNSDVTELNCFDEVMCVTRFGNAMRAVSAFVDEFVESFPAKTNIIASKTNMLLSKLGERSLSFVNALHKAHVEAITNAVQSERWIEAKLPRGTARLVAAVTDNTVSSFGRRRDSIDSPSSESKSSQNVLQVLLLSQQTYKTVACGQRFIRSACAFALIPSKLPFAASEGARRGVELFRHFNVLCGQAILGAFALQWAGLRSITARHLALASRTVALEAALHPFCVAMLQTAVQSDQRPVFNALALKVEKDLREHHAQLLAKILSIMTDRLAVHEDAMRALPWNKEMEMHRYEVPSVYITSLAKEATVLHKILYSVLPQNEVTDIFQRVFASYAAHLSTFYDCLDLEKYWIRQRVVADVDHLYNRIFGLEVVNEAATTLKPIENLRSRFGFDLKTSEEQTKLQSEDLQRYESQQQSTSASRTALDESDRIATDQLYSAHQSPNQVQPCPAGANSRRKEVSDSPITSTLPHVSDIPIANSENLVEFEQSDEKSKTGLPTRTESASADEVKSVMASLTAEAKESLLAARSAENLNTSPIARNVGDRVGSSHVGPKLVHDELFAAADGVEIVSNCDSDFGSTATDSKPQEESVISDNVATAPPISNVQHEASDPEGVFSSSIGDANVESLNSANCDLP